MHRHTFSTLSSPLSAHPPVCRRQHRPVRRQPLNPSNPPISSVREGTPGAEFPPRTPTNRRPARRVTSRQSSVSRSMPRIGRGCNGCGNAAGGAAGGGDISGAEAAGQRTRAAQLAGERCPRAEDLRAVVRCWLGSNRRDAIAHSCSSAGELSLSAVTPCSAARAHARLGLMHGCVPACREGPVNPETVAGRKRFYKSSPLQ